MEREHEQMNLYNLAGGAAAEKFNIELGRVMANILDPNTTEGNRSITLKVSFKPLDAERRKCGIVVACTSTLAPDIGIASQMYIHRSSNGRFAAYENNPDQLMLDLEEQDRANRPANVAPLNQEREVS